jgi:hypothetical protein
MKKLVLFMLRVHVLRFSATQLTGVLSLTRLAFATNIQPQIAIFSKHVRILHRTFTFMSWKPRPPPSGFPRKAMTPCALRRAVHLKDVGLC